MLDFSRGKIVAVFCVCLLFILLAIPNLLPEKTRETIPGFLPSRTVNLGLDLQGGSYLLLQLELDRYMHEQLADIVDSLRTAMISKKVMYRGLGITGAGNNETVSFTLINNSNVNVKDMVREISPELEIVSQKDGTYNIGYSQEALKTKKLHLLEQSIQIVNRRVNETGTREPIIQRQGDDRIVLQVPGLQDPERLKALLGKTAKMTFHLVEESLSMSDLASGKVPAGVHVMYEDERGGTKEKPIRMPVGIKTKVMLSGDLLVDASATFDNQTNEPVVSFRFNTVGAQKFAEITRENVGKRFAIVLDGKVITAPVIRSAILGGSGIISGNFTSESANDLAVLLRSGALPVPLKVVEERSVGPSLGADSINAGKQASLLGVVLVMGFMLINYGIFGIFANVALFFNLVFIMGALSLFQATLTLPGIAGMVLTLGMAVDANVLIYERIREELRNGKTPFTAIDQGFRAARGTIMDANVTTLIAAILLFYFGTGTVKGFAVTLAIGILASMFTAIVLTRLMVSVWLRRTRPKIVPI
ncbi:MAG TPA: protein translocase subunit SecD [Rickettsiales bacterium]|nr:protein translocase subunit SecD [Rickettsiales bacterium]